ncbi:MinD/ParA family ATP-binding protein [Microbacterium tumbae]
MTAKKTTDPAEEDSLGVLDAAASLDTTGIGLLGGTAQVNVAIPTGDEDDLVDDSVIGEVVSDLIIDDAEDAAGIGRIQGGSKDIVIELPADEPPAEPVPVEAVTAEVIVESADAEGEPSADAGATTPEAVEPEIVVEPVPAPRRPVAEPESEPAPKADPLVPEAAPRPASPWVTSVERAAAGTASEPAEKATEIVSDDKPSIEPQSALAPKPSGAQPRADVELTAKRLGDQLGQAARESADLLTADRLLDPHQITRPEPEGAWSHFLYSVSGRRINIGDGRKAKARKALSARIAAPLSGGARFVPVLSRKGGVGKTAVTALLGMALADARDDRVIAVDANPDRGTLAERIVRSHGRSVRDLVRARGEVRGYHDISAIVARDATRLDVLASDTDPRIADAFSDADYRDVADVAAHYYSLVLTDTGTGIVHSVMGATLELADQLVIVSGLSVDEARLASETLTWLETNGYAELARNAVVVLNQSTPGSPLVRLNELEAHFGTRAGHVLRIPYDAQIAGGGPIVFSALQPETRQAARELAALLVEGLRTGVA